jgi:flagellar motor protein MotB
LLAVVGDPYVLYQDAHWRDLIQYCQSNNSYIGPEIRLDNFEAREKKEQQHKESQQQLKQQQQQQKQEEQQRQQQQLQLQKQEEDERLKQQQQFQLQLQQQQQQLQLAEQQKRQSQQPATKGSHPPPSPTQPPQNQHTQPPKPSAWQPLPAAVETERATLAPAPTTAQLLLGSAPPAMLPATQNPPPAQQLPPQGGFVVHAPAAHPWPWNGQPPQQHPLHPYHTTLGQHQSMPVVFNPHSLPYFTPSVLHPSPLPAMPHHLLAQPPIPAPAAFQPPPTVDTAAATTPGSAIAVVSAEERRANELLARQMMAPQPRPLPGLADESEAEEEQNEYAPLYSFEGQPLIMAKKTAPGYPAVMINEKDGALVVKISMFGLSVTVQRNGQLIYVRLREAAEVKNALFTLPLLHAMPTPNGKRSKKAQSGERAVLLVAVPQGFDQSRTKYEEGQTLLIITMVRPALSTRLLTVTTTKTDLL